MQTETSRAAVSKTAAEWAVAIIRIAVGWHFLYEGLWKVFQHGEWTCLGYLNASGSFAKPMFEWMAEQPWLVAAADQMVAWGLVALGLGLMSGVFARLAAPFGMLLLGFFFAAQPPEPFAGAAPAMAGRYFLVDFNVLEIAALAVVACVPSPSVLAVFVRRFAIPAVSVAALVVFAALFAREWKAGRLAPAAQAKTSATVKNHQFAGAESIKRPLAAKAKFGALSLPRVVMAGEYFSGRSHGRDLIWTDEFMRRYNRPETIKRTVEWARAGGLGAMYGSSDLLGKLRENRARPRDLVFISDCSGEGSFAERVKRSVREGAQAITSAPDELDAVAERGDAEAAKKIYGELKGQKIPFGLAARKVETLKFCVGLGFAPDFWCVSFHPTNYPSARSVVAGRTKSVWCADPKAVVDFFKTRDEPWMAIDAAAYGAVPVAAALKFSADAGAAAVCVDVLDFQVVDVAAAAVRQFDGDDGAKAGEAKGAKK